MLYAVISVMVVFCLVVVYVKAKECMRHRRMCKTFGLPTNMKVEICHELPVDSILIVQKKPYIARMIYAPRPRKKKNQ